ncbi:uncharacterized protein LOC123314235 isoform X2 [Coccinella septempunctata]|uniref:uncharacterized protein LOC123314235 isoform X2 n=1 Tax=Coccinella septempunctata TaxID=41139 RepID=UPI001D0865BD|nr:uncharacterized protein LOC123314235 isoform X2 [Coccinella septempunctata]
MSLDLAEVVEDLICTFEGHGDATMDTLAMFVFGWILAALFVLWVGKFVYAKVSERLGEREKRAEASKTAADAADAKKAAPLTKSASFKSSPSPRAGYVPPTPPVRKRLTRASPGPELRKPAKYIPAPQCTGPDNVCVLWVNDVFQWLYNDHLVVSELLDCWIRSLNEYMKKAALDQGITVELIRILPETNPPVIGNVFAECDSKDDVTITCDCEATPAFQLKSLRQKDEKTETSHFRVNVNRFRARLNIFCVTEKLQADVKCDGWPEIKVALAPVGNIKNSLDENHLQEVISDIFVNAVRNTEVHLNLAQYPQCPKLIRHVEMPTGHFLPVHYDSMNKAFTSTPNHVTPDSPMIGPSSRRLLVKVVRAAQLGGPQGCKDPFCVIEMDEPSQKNQTSVQKGTDSPSWDEHFLLDVTSSTSEILFEIYDHAENPHRFLGVGIVGVEELLINPSQRQIISLQGRPYESDPITGTLTVEFMFIEGADIPFLGESRPYKIKETIPNTTISRNLNTSSSNHSFRHNDNLTNGHLNDSLAHRDHGLNSTENNTIIIHSVQKQPSQRIVKVELVNGTWKEIDVKEEEPNEENPKISEDSGVYTNGDASNGKILSDSTLDTTDANTSAETENSEQGADRSPVKGGAFAVTDEPPPQEFRGRAKKRRDFFGTIKRRLGKSKNRSKSAGPENDVGRDDSLNRSISADRNRNDRYQLNLPGHRSLEETSRRSSLSEASGLSTASGRTYVNEASTLVLETMENGIKKHYLVPLSLAQKSKWRKKGIKLHIFNDHTFIAKHLSGSTTCQVCLKSIARRIGKQGYECRDCQMKCHKHCHVKVNDNCPTSTIHNIELSMLPVLSE